jgi:hypothetical protein
MKSKVFFGFAIVVLVLVLFFNVLNAGPFPPEEEVGGSLYDRYDYNCQDMIREGRFCLPEGSESCSPISCDL